MTQRCSPRAELHHPGRPIILQCSRGGTSSKFRDSVENWMVYVNQVPGIGLEGISVTLRIARVSSSGLIGLGVLYLQVGVVQGHRVGNIFYLRVRW